MRRFLIIQVENILKIDRIQTKARNYLQAAGNIQSIILRVTIEIRMIQTILKIVFDFNFFI